MDVRQLRNFIGICELSSITAAADALGVAQPALSRQVKAMEEELGIPLLQRHGRGVMPTEEGLRLAARSRRIVEDFDNLRHDIAGDTETLSGRLTLGLPPTVAEVLATHLMLRAMEEHPAVRLRVVSGFSGHVRDWLTRGRIDLGVAYEGQSSVAVHSQPIIQEQLFLISAADSANEPADTFVDAADALARPMILPNPEHGLRARVASIAEGIGIDLDVVQEVDILPTMLAFVERGIGDTILPLVSVIDRVRAGRVIARPIAGAPVDRALVLMTPLNRPESRLATGFASFLMEEVHGLSASGEWPGTTR